MILSIKNIQAPKIQIRGMKRRYKALIAILIPILMVSLLKFVHPISYQWLMGYMFAIALVFKTSILSLWLVTQLNIMEFIKSLTLLQGFILVVKRWFDGVFATWIQVYVIENLLEALKEAKIFYLRQDLKRKFKNIFLFLFSTFFSTWLLYFTGVLDNLLLFAEIKLFIAGVFKALITFFTKLFSWLIALFAIAWLGPILQVFALSFLFTHLEKWFGEDNFLSRFINFLGNKINLGLYYLGILRDKHIDPILIQPVINKSKKMNTKLSSHIQQQKIREEYQYFESFENIIMQGHIDAYHSFKGMEKCKDKEILYAKINQKTSNNLDIVAYVSRDEKGNLLVPNTQSNFKHDVFLLESYASHKEHGVKVYERALDEFHIDHSDFWVLNTSAYPLTLRSNSHNFEDTQILAHGLQLIKVRNPFCYKHGDVFCEFEEVRVSVKAIERI